MARTNRRKAPFVVSVVAMTAVGSVVACGGSTSDDAGLGGAGGGGNSGGSSSGGTSVGGMGGNHVLCPESFPTSATVCTLPSGTTCSYDQGPCCPDWGATCTGGKWEAFATTCNPPPPNPCPDQVPVAGSLCGTDEPCGNSQQYCTYGTCTDGSPATVAQCSAGVWELASNNECSPPACETLTACECFARADCMPESDGCLCPCDFSCPGEPPCECACGGGYYLGCTSSLEG